MTIQSSGRGRPGTNSLTAASHGAIMGIRDGESDEPARTSRSSLLARRTRRISAAVATHPPACAADLATACRLHREARRTRRPVPAVAPVVAAFPEKAFVPEL